MNFNLAKLAKFLERVTDPKQILATYGPVRKICSGNLVIESANGVERSLSVTNVGTGSLMVYTLQDRMSTDGSWVFMAKKHKNADEENYFITAKEIGPATDMVELYQSNRRDVFSPKNGGGSSTSIPLTLLKIAAAGVVLFYLPTIAAIFTLSVDKVRQGVMTQSSQQTVAQAPAQMPSLPSATGLTLAPEMMAALQSNPELSAALKANPGLLSETLKNNPALAAELQSKAMLAGGAAAAPSATSPGTPQKPALNTEARISPEEASSLAAIAGQFDLSPKAEGKVLYVFTDPLCPHCKRLDATLSKIPAGYRPKLIPVAFQEGSKELAAAVLCAKDKRSAWIDAIQYSKTKEASCQDGIKSIEANNALFTSMRLNSTPMMISPNGYLFSGYADSQQILNVLSN